MYANGETETMITSALKRCINRLVLSAAILMSVHASVLADEIQPAFVLGDGLMTCKTWTEHHLAGGPQHVADVAWVFGFLSGFNEFDQRSKRPFLSQDEAVVQSSIDRFCVESPEKHVMEIVVRLSRSSVTSPPTSETKP
jgi:hypothetical protein